ncbi:hypothetical protein [Actinoplanes sp. L3-i22]|uniref:hypothetical protein n=1 Tax=Actinoplanes sp. L3-i22 TaxID=2836373 RepID=UPI001C775691|nr:hypothetical protein [Actinoplanes sp. L3-i22]BCY07988.1 hypothetical protein L3i22_030760 [Actinoplanes sp. L3-i22]
MNRAQRFLALTGMSLAAGAMIGAGPVQAAPSTGQSSTSGSTAGRASGFGDENVVGYYRTEWACERAGFTGRRFHAWDDYDCDPIHYGWRGWVFQLVVDDDDWVWDDWRGSWPGGWPYRPDFAGRPFHIRGGDGPGPHGRPMNFPPRDMGDRGPRDMGDRGPRDMGDRGPRDMGDRGPQGPGDRGPQDMGDRGPQGGQGPKGWPRP